MHFKIIQFKLMIHPKLEDVFSNDLQNIMILKFEGLLELGKASDQ